MNNDENNAMTTRDDFGNEVTIEALPHGRNDELRISICSYKGSRFVNLRVWFRGTDHRFRPTKTGVTLQPRQLESIIKALQETKRRLEQSVEEREHDARSPMGIAVER